MRPIVRHFLGYWRDTLVIREPIVEFGAYQVEPGDDLRPVFHGRRYVGTDARPGPGVEAVLDLHALGLRAGVVGTAVCVDTLEHVTDPIRAMAEVHRVLMPGGLALVASVMNFPIHCEPDLWRFTPEGLERLLLGAGFADVQVLSHDFRGRQQHPETVVGVGVKG